MVVWAGHGTEGGEKGATFCVGYARGWEGGDLQSSSCIHCPQVQRKSVGRAFKAT